MRRARILLRACRPRQWVKNVLVLAAPIAGGMALHPQAIGQMAVAVVAFCVASSGVYLVNDALDVESDRAHATKRNRPIASGELPVRTAWITAIVLLPGALVTSALLNWQLLVIVAIYEVIQLWYCMGMKHEPVIELTSVASIPLVDRATPLQLALGIIRREALERSLSLTYPGGTATPVALPYEVP